MISSTLNKQFSEVPEVVRRYINEKKKLSVFNKETWLEFGVSSEVERLYFSFLNEGKFVAFMSGFVKQDGLYGKIFILDPRKGGIFLTKGKDPESINFVINEITKSCKNEGISLLDLRYQFLDDPSFLGILKENRFKIENSNVDLIAEIQNNFSDQRDGFSSSRKSELAQAIKNELVCKQIEDEVEYIDYFYPPYESSMKRKGVKPIEKESLLKMFQELKDDFLFTVVLKDEVPMAAVAFVKDEYSKSLYYYYSGVDLSFSKLRPMEMTIAWAFEWAIDNKYKYFNFMSTGSDIRSGVFKFKKQWGTFPGNCLSVQKPLTLKSKLIKLLLFLKSTFL